jgi:hypothetical protein
MRLDKKGAKERPVKQGDIKLAKDIERSKRKPVNFSPGYNVCM